MSGPQFMHMETYAVVVSKVRKKREADRAANKEVVDRKLTVEEICGEAARVPGCCPHLEETKAPVLLFGISPDQVPAILNERIELANEAIRAEKAKTPRGTRSQGTRSIRIDTHTLVTMVTSYPTPWLDPNTRASNFADPDNEALLDLWTKRNLAWMHAQAKKLGFEIMSVVMHVDEPFPHIHMIGVPLNKRLEARACHPGYAAKSKLGEADKGQRDKAYKDAMRAFQDGYFLSVGLEVGLLRTGPKRRRVPTGVYKAEKAEGRARGLATVHVEQKKTELAEVAALVDATERGAVDTIIETTNFESELRRVQRELVQAKEELEAKQHDLTSLEDLGFELQKIGCQLEDERAQLERAKRERKEAEAKAANARQEADRLNAENSRVREELKQDRNKLEDDRREFHDERNKLQADIAEREDAVERSRQELDAVIEGVEAFADGRLLFDPHNQTKPFRLDAKAEGFDEGLKERLLPVKPRLLKVVRALNAKLTRRADAMSGALTAAVEGWASGLFEGLDEPGADGRPTFKIAATGDGKKLRERILPFRDLVARVISVLPERTMMTELVEGLAWLRPRLSERDEEEQAEKLSATLSALSQKGLERD